MLSFAVQPVMGKLLLPIYGGSAGTWLGAMIYFQLALLLGYGWATWLLSRSARVQRWATLGLAGLALISFRLPGLDTAPGGIGRIVAILSFHSLPAMMLLFSVSPLMHGWLQRRDAQVPYYLYALSNLGSLVGLVSYPFLIEPFIGLSAQGRIIHGGIALVSGLIAGAVALGGGLETPTDQPAARAEGSPERRATPPRTVLAWLALSLLTCVVMLGATDLLAAEVGSSPLAWVGPFGAYLLSFTVAFSGQWRNWMTGVAAIGLTVGLTGFMFCKGPSSTPLAGAGFFFLLLAVGSACLVGNAILYRLRPPVRFDRYYLTLAAGGVVGGLLVSLVLPQVFPRPVEFVAASTILLLCGVGVTVTRREPLALTVAAFLVVTPLAGLGYRAILSDSHGTTTKHFRNEYGHMFIRTRVAGEESRVELLSASTLHGSQIHGDRFSTRRPTQYYTEAGAAGRTILHLRQSRPTMRIGVIGLGAGTLAAYGRPGDEIRFWDIDPKAIQIADREFTYVRESLAKVEVVQADGRRALASSTEDFDVLVVDAFAGDSVPAHLVTVEALQIYFARLEARQGTLVIHASSRYNDPFLVLANTALAAGRQAIGIITHVAEAGNNTVWDASATEYLVIPTSELASAFPTVFPRSEDDGRITRSILALKSTEPDPALVWTDDRHAGSQMLDLRRYLTWKTF